MNRQFTLSNVTKEYLSAFHCILDDMTDGMTEVRPTYSISHNFIAQMIPHHRAAIEMSRNILRYTTNLELQEIATQIIAEQTRSIENMQSIQQVCDRLENSRQDACLYQRRANQIMRNMFCRMEEARAVNELGCNFMREMIPHHQGAVEMSANALQYHICPELRPVLNAIIASQQRGIRQMRRLLRRLGCC